MVKQELQIDYKTKSIRAMDSEAWTAIAEKFQDHKIVTVKVSGIEKHRSIPELNLFHSCVKLTSEMTDDVEWNTPDKAKLQLKIALQFFDNIVVSGPKVFFTPGSLSFTAANQAKSHSFIKEAIKHMANKLDVEPDVLVDEAKSRMRRR
jgi:hypothetical protein